MSAPGSSSQPGPLRSVLAAMESGCGTVAEVARVTGLTRDGVDAAVDHLIRMGRLTARPMTTGCSDGGCGTCPSSAGSGAGCGSPATGPVLVALSISRP